MGAQDPISLTLFEYFSSEYMEAMLSLKAATLLCFFAFIGTVGRSTSFQLTPACAVKSRVMNRPHQQLHMVRQSRMHCVGGHGSDAGATDVGAAAQFNECELESKEITRLKKRIDSIRTEIEEVRAEQAAVAEQISSLNVEYGEEIARVKREFSRMKARAFEESQMAVNMAKVDAVKEVLPVTDNYLRAKSVFKTPETDNERLIIETYDAVFESLNKVLNDFGLTKVESVGKPFDFNFMEAITAQPSTEYASDVVMMEYQVGYKMGDRCVRPAMVVVSQGPGPSL